MIESILKLVDNLTNRKISINKRLGNLILILFLLLSIDFIFQITYSIYQTNKLSNLEKIVQLKTAYKNNPKKLKYIIELENETLNKNHYYSFVRDFWVYSRSIIKDTQYRNGKTELSYFWSILSSTILFLILILFAIISPFIHNRMTLNDLREVAVGVLFLIILTVIMIIISSLLPIIINPVITYIVFFIIQIFMIFLFSIVIMQQEVRLRKKHWEDEQRLQHSIYRNQNDKQKNI